MNNNKDYYQILGIKSGDSFDAIKKAYRKLAKEYHPDRNRSPYAHDKFIEIQEAYEILIDPKKRKIYDSVILNTESIEYDTTDYEKEFKEWINTSRENAVNYAKMSYNKYVKRVFGEIGFNLKQVFLIIGYILTIIIGLLPLTLGPPLIGVIMIIMGLLGLWFTFKEYAGRYSKK